jgi:hypothetical protein
LLAATPVSAPFQSFRDGLRSGVDDHPYLQSALDSLNYHRVTPLGVKLRGIRLAIL